MVLSPSAPVSPAGSLILLRTQGHLAPTIPTTQPGSFLPAPSQLEAHHAQPNTVALQMPSKGLSIISTSPRRDHKPSMAPTKVGAASLSPGTHRTRSCFSPAKSFLLIRVMLLPLSSLQREEAEISKEALQRCPGTGAPQELPKKGRQGPKDSSGCCISVPLAGHGRASHWLQRGPSSSMASSTGHTEVWLARSVQAGIFHGP